jgi:aliphatic aldoxime dehydratase
MESAIPEHLRCPRSQVRRAPSDYVPAVPAWVARFGPEVTRVVMGYFGVQFRGDAGQATAKDFMRRMYSWCVEADGPVNHETVQYCDEAGFGTMILVAYWGDVAAHGRWLAAEQRRQWWESEERDTDGVGYFREIFSPRSKHFETLFSSPDRFEGVARLTKAVSEEIFEHGYWGGARDRLPSTQTDGLEPGPVPALTCSGARRLHVTPQRQLALIRSGQDWTDTEADERKLYLDEVEPVLGQGMTFLRDSGRGIGCYSNRYVRHLDEAGHAQEKSFGMSLWRSLAHLEVWAGSHPTHLAIFGSFMRMVKATNFQPRLRLYHEVAVLAEDEQSFEYVNCHPRTGMLGTVTRACTHKSNVGS